MINTFPALTCVCFFGFGATDFETLPTSLWTSVKIWLRFSTFSFFTAPICEAADQVWAKKPQTTKNSKRVKEENERRYMFECCRDRFRFVLVFQVFVRHLKDVLLFFPFLFIPRHVTWGENTNQHRYMEFLYTTEPYIQWNDVTPSLSILAAAVQTWTSWFNQMLLLKAVGKEEFH